MWRGRAHAPPLRCALCCDSRVPLIDADTSLRFSLKYFIYAFIGRFGNASCSATASAARQLRLAPAA